MDLLTLLTTLKNGKAAQIAAWNNLTGSSHIRYADLLSAMQAFDTSLGVEQAIGDITSFNVDFRQLLIDFLREGVTNYNAAAITAYGNSTCRDMTILYAPTKPVQGTSLEQCFYACRWLFYIENIDMTGVVNCRSLFANCKMLRQLPASFSMPDVTIASGMFQYCTSLTSLPSGMTAPNVTNAQAMFYGCQSLTSLPSGMTFSRITNCSQMFTSCNHLISLPDGITFELCTTGPQMFQDCSRLISLPNSICFRSMTKTSIMFSNCRSLTSFGNAFANGTGVITDAVSMFSTCTSAITIGGSVNIGGIQFWGGTTSANSTGSVYKMFLNSTITTCGFTGTYQFDFDIDLTIWGFQNLDEASIVSFMSCLQSTIVMPTLKLTAAQKAYVITIESDTYDLETYGILLGYDVI